MSANGGNIFEEFLTVKQTVLDNSTIDNDFAYDIEYVKLIQVIEDYFSSFKWVREGKEKAVYLRSGKGLRTSTIADMLNMNHSTYRSMVSKLSMRLRNLLFNGEDMSTAILSASKEKVIATRKHIEYLLLAFDFYSFYSDDALALIQKYSKVEGETSEPTEEEMFSALLVLAYTSNRTIEYRLKSLNPLALKKVISELTSDEYNVWVKYYQELGVGGKPVASEAMIQRLKQSVE